MTTPKCTAQTQPDVSYVAAVFQPTPEQTARAAFDVRDLAERTGYRAATDWTIPEAFLCLILMAAAADGVVPPEEHLEIRALARRSRVLKSVDAAHLAQLNRTIGDRIKHRPQAMQEASEALAVDMRPSLLAHCADILLADGGLAPAEAEFLNRLTSCLGIAEDQAVRIVEALLIKNRY